MESKPHGKLSVTLHTVVFTLHGKSFDNDDFARGTCNILLFMQCLARYTKDGKSKLQNYVLYNLFGCI